MPAFSYCGFPVGLAGDAPPVVKVESGIFAPLPAESCEYGV